MTQYSEQIKSEGIKISSNEKIDHICHLLCKYPSMREDDRVQKYMLHISAKHL